MRFTFPDIDTDAHPKATRQAFTKLHQVIQESWRNYNDALRPLLPSPLNRLLDFNFQDSPLATVRWYGETKTLTLLLWEGPRLANEYFPWYLTYHDVEMSPATRRLLAYLAEDSGDDVANHEVDLITLDRVPVFVHRILWHTDFSETKELEIRFCRFEWEMGPQSMTKYSVYHQDNVGIEQLDTEA
ncbi:MAG: hypothetical protein H8F28_19360 [Fibrella sp.]|nr:hypothetical protein [Armatimonadota bacterium]